jgi:hypothetical protein
MEVDTITEWKDVTADVESAEAQVNEEEEAYRLRALDYALGHVAAKVKDSKKVGGTTSSNKPGSLLAAMLKSAQSVASVSGAVEDTGNGEIIVMGDVVGTQDMRLKEAQDEFERFAKKASKAPKEQPNTMDSDDDDEEETTTILESEFQSTLKPDNTKEPTTETNDDDIDDLAMAIKKKKKKTKNRK